jgi:myo-inositol-1(or 4)-monophosphatase
MDLEQICCRTIALVKEVGQFVYEENHKLTQDKVRFKGKNDLVTYVDTTSEKRLVTGLHKICPEAGFITEEGTTSRTAAAYQWVIDPLDGTTNYVHGVPFYAISVALMQDKEVIVGVVHEINQDECFYAWQNSKAYCNEREIQVSQVGKLEESLLATGFPYVDLSRMEPYIALLTELLQTSQGIRRLGSAAADLAYVACGRFDGFYEYNLKPWDVAAGALIVERAGGEVCDFKGGSDYIWGQEIIAANSQVRQELLAKVRSFF